MHKTIIIGLPKSFEFHSVLQQNLADMGFNVIDISYVDHDFKYPSFYHRLLNFIRKTFLNDKGYKNKLKFLRFSEETKKKLNSLHKKADYTLLIRPDIYPIDLLKEVRKKTEKMVAYQWDGLHRFPAVYATIRYFDKFFVFDTKDLQYNKHKLHPLTNFYFNDRVGKNESSAKYDVFFVGSFVRKRMKAISELADLFVKFRFTPKIMIYCQPTSLEKEFPNPHIEYIFQHLPYSKNIQMVKESNVLLDFVNHSHKGLSFRTFEALYYEKKLITTNTEIKKYDFYNRENIFILDPENYSKKKLAEFLRGTYQPIDENIVKKYSFTNWIKYVLDMQPFQVLNLPN